MCPLHWLKLKAARRCKYLKCHDAALYSVACIDPNTAVTGDEDGFVKM